MEEIEPERIRVVNSAPERDSGEYVLYWSQSSRRVESNHGLTHAASLANAHDLPLLVYEGLTCSYPEANDRLHTFVIEAAPDTARELRSIHAGYFLYLRQKESDPNDILYRLAARARCVVTDEYPVFIPAMHNRSVPERIGVRYIAVDSNCIVPTSIYGKREYAAYTIRPKIKRELRRFLKPLARVRLKHPWGDELLPEDVRALRVDVQPENVAALVAAAEINHAVRPSPSFRGGVKHARRNLKIFLEQKLRDYAKESNQPARHGTSDLSPWQPVAEVWQTECLPHLGSQHIECRWWRRRFRLRSGRLWTSATGC